MNEIEGRIKSILNELCSHDGFGEFKVETKILKRKQKEVIIHYGKQYRYVIDAVEQ